MSTVVGTIVLERGLRAAFVKAFNNFEDPKDVMAFMMETTSDGADEKYGWLGQSPMMGEWIDERKLKALNSFDYSLTNKDYEATLSVDRNEIEDDRLGNVKVRIDDLARKAKQSHPRKLFFDALVAGTSALCYDGLPLFSASHVEGLSGTQSNIVTGTGSTLAQLAADMQSAVAALLGFKDDQGEPYNEGDIQIGIICPVALKQKFEDLNTLDLISNSSNNMKGKIKQLTSSARLTDAGDWYLADITPGIKPFIRQIRKAVTFSSLEGTSDNGFMRKKYHYGVDSREVFGYGLWQKIVKVNN